jgi:hypothetical protein
LGGPLPKPNMSIIFASIGEPNAIKKSGIPNNFFSNCAIKRGIHHNIKTIVIFMTSQFDTATIFLGSMKFLKYVGLFMNKN